MSVRDTRTYLLRGGGRGGAITLTRISPRKKQLGGPGLPPPYVAPSFPQNNKQQGLKTGSIVYRSETRIHTLFTTRSKDMVRC